VLEIQIPCEQAQLADGETSSTINHSDDYSNLPSRTEMIFLQPISIALFLLASARPLDAIDTASGQSVSVSERGRGGEGGIDQLGSAGWLGWLSGLGFGDVQVTLLVRPSFVSAFR
jgi:hypothetical protein